MNRLKVSRLRESFEIPVFGAYRYQLKNIHLVHGTPCKPIHRAFQLRIPYRYRPHKPFQPPCERQLWRNQNSCLDGFGLYDACDWLAREKLD